MGVEALANLGSAAILGGAFLFGVRWILSHMSRLHKDLVEAYRNHSDMLGKVVAQNTTALQQVEKVMSQVEKKIVTGKVRA